MSAEPCGCGHDRSWHGGGTHSGKCGAPTFAGYGQKRCRCERFKAAERTSAADLVRVRPGLYRTRDERWEILRGDTGCDWDGMWLFRTVDGQVDSDPVATLREAREGLQAAIDARAK